MSFRQWFQPPRRVLVVFAGMTSAFILALSWLGWHFLENNRSIEDRRVQSQLANAAEEVTASLEQRLQAMEHRKLPLEQPGEVTIRMEGQGLQLLANPPDRLAYYPSMPGAEPDLNDAFAAAEQAEFRDGRIDSAVGLYRTLADSPAAAVRAGATLRLARALLKARRQDEALRTYDQLAQYGGTTLEPGPAELVASDARARIFQSLGRRKEAARNAAFIQAGLRAHRWQVTRAMRAFYAAEAANWGFPLPTDDHEKYSLALSAAANWLWQQGENGPRMESPVILKSAEGPVLAVWEVTGQSLRAVLAAPSLLTEAIRARDRSVNCSLLNRAGQLLAGAPVNRGPRELRTVAGIPWIVAASLVDPVGDLANYESRRRLVFLGFAVVALALGAGSYYIIRSILREQALARLQAGFVSAVSHELRTPLSSIVQISEMLSADRIPLEETATSFQHLVRESRRLQKLVDSLLDFRRMQDGAARYLFEPMDAALLETIIQVTTGEYQRAVLDCKHRIEFERSDGAGPVRADRTSLKVAIWNLLDNAVKYSPGREAVRIELHGDSESCIISVCDQGLGISATEQSQVFVNFYRGSASRTAHVKGTGIGLAVVKQIAEAHRGEVRLESSPGRGSTFHLRLPKETVV